MNRALIVIGVIALLSFAIWRDFACLAAGGDITFNLNKTYVCNEPGDVK